MSGFFAKKCKECRAPFVTEYARQDKCDACVEYDKNSSTYRDLANRKDSPTFGWGRIGGFMPPRDSFEKPRGFGEPDPDGGLGKA